MNQLNEPKRKDNEFVQEFNQRFEKIIKRNLDEVKPKENVILLHCMDGFEGTFGFMLKEKSPIDPKDAQEKEKKMEKNVSTSIKVDLI